MRSEVRGQKYPGQDLTSDSWRLTSDIRHYELNHTSRTYSQKLLHGQE